MVRHKKQSIGSYFTAFKYALEGLVHAYQQHPSFKIEVIAAIMTIILGVSLHITRGEWIIITWVIFSVLVAELLNTSVETALDYLAIEHHIDVKIAKDVAAGAVLLLSIASVIVGGLIFIPHILNL